MGADFDTGDPFYAADADDEPVAEIVGMTQTVHIWPAGGSYVVTKRDAFGGRSSREANRPTSLAPRGVVVSSHGWAEMSDTPDIGAVLAFHAALGSASSVILRDALEEIMP